MNFFRINIAVCLVSFFVCANQAYASLPCQDLPTESIPTECLSAESLSTLDSLQPDQVMQDEDKDKIVGKRFKNLGSSVAVGALVASGLIFGGALHLFCAGQKNDQVVGGVGQPPVIATASAESGQARGVDDQSAGQVGSLGFIFCDFDFKLEHMGKYAPLCKVPLNCDDSDKVKYNVCLSMKNTDCNLIFKINVSQANNSKIHENVNALILYFLSQEVRKKIFENHQVVTVVLSFTENNKNEYLDSINLVNKQWRENVIKPDECPVDRYTDLNLNNNQASTIYFKLFDDEQKKYGFYGNSVIAQALTEENIEQMFGFKK